MLVDVHGEDRGHDQATGQREADDQSLPSGFAGHVQMGRVHRRVNEQKSAAAHHCHSGQIEEQDEEDNRSGGYEKTARGILSNPQ